MASQKNIELRYYFIGDEGVGKKSICQRFKKLSSSETIEGKSSKLEVGEKDLKFYRKMEENKYKNNEELKEMIIMKLKEKNATNFVKIYTVSNLNIEQRFFIPSRANPVTYSDGKEIVEELDELEKVYKLKFDSTKSDIKGILKQQNINYLRAAITETKHIFVFVYDLSVEESLEKAIVYFEELNKAFNILNNPDYYILFLANKLDIRNIGKPVSYKSKVNSYNITSETNFGGGFQQENSGVDNLNEKKSLSHHGKVNVLDINNENDDQYNSTYGNHNDLLYRFLKKYQEHNIRVYDISTKMFFNFEKLFERMYNDILHTVDPALEHDYVKEKFLNILHLRKTFSKASKQDILIINKSNPSPQDYNADIYFINSDEEKKKAFSSRKRYQFKMFLNKVGPVFKNSKSLSRNEVGEGKKKSYFLTSSKEEEESKKRRMKLLEEINAQKNGFTLGIVPGKDEFLKQRKGNKKLISQSFEKALSLSNITKPPQPSRIMNVHPKVVKQYKAHSRERFDANRNEILKE